MTIAAPAAPDDKDAYAAEHPEHSDEELLRTLPGAIRLEPLPVPLDIDQESDENVDQVKAHILSKVHGRRRVPLVGLDEVYNKIYSLMEQTVTEGEGNSCLLIGPRACGKTAVVETALAELRRQHPYEFLTVRLSGFAQTDDKMALREISTQLEAERAAMDAPADRDDTEGRARRSKPSSEVMARLLALLAHPEEHGTSYDVVSIVVVLDEFDRFTMHARQMLLYNLFDIAQSRKAPVCVIGVSARMNAGDMLEKRVKSRFSHRVLQVAPAATVGAFWQVARQCLTVERDAAGQYVLRDGPAKTPALAAAAESWNRNVDELYADASGAVRQLVERVFVTTKDVRQLCLAWAVAVAMAGARYPHMTPRMVTDHSIQPLDSQLEYVLGLSELELVLLICATRVELKYTTGADGEQTVAKKDGPGVINFNIVYDEYHSLSVKSKLDRNAAGSIVDSVVRIWGRELAMAAWENLESAQLIVPQTGPVNGGGDGAGSREMKSMLSEVSMGELAEIVQAMDVPDTVKAWCRTL
ncbi:origin recognition complex, subunit 4 [Dipodascopsis tothii]|uniref:origin recognition complex, subunit 4 n=1 Tax=Dipodascopsis tothii TaxID=44089 RepID=UPI0034CFFB07